MLLALAVVFADALIAEGGMGVSVGKLNTMGAYPAAIATCSSFVERVFFEIQGSCLSMIVVG